MNSVFWLFFLGEIDKMLPKLRLSKPIFGHSARSTKLDQPYCKEFRLKLFQSQHMLRQELLMRTARSKTRHCAVDLALRSPWCTQSAFVDVNKQGIGSVPVTPDLILLQKHRDTDESRRIVIQIGAANIRHLM